MPDSPEPQAPVADKAPSLTTQIRNYTVAMVIVASGAAATIGIRDAHKQLDEQRCHFLVSRRLHQELAEREAVEHSIADARDLQKRSKVAEASELLLAASSMHDLEGRVFAELASLYAERKANRDDKAVLTYAQRCIDAINPYLRQFGVTRLPLDLVPSDSTSGTNVLQDKMESTRGKEDSDWRPMALRIEDHELNQCSDALYRAGQVHPYESYRRTEAARLRPMLRITASDCYLHISKSLARTGSLSGALAAANSAVAYNPTGSTRNQVAIVMILQLSKFYVNKPRFLPDTAEKTVQTILRILMSVERDGGKEGTDIGWTISERDLYLALHNIAVLHSLWIASGKSDPDTSKWRSKGLAYLRRSLDFGGRKGFAKASLDPDLTALLGQAPPSAIAIEEWVELLCTNADSECRQGLRAASGRDEEWFERLPVISVESVASPATPTR